MPPSNCKTHLARYENHLKYPNTRNVLRMFMEEINSRGESHFRPSYVKTIKYLFSKIASPRE